MARGPMTPEQKVAFVAKMREAKLAKRAGKSPVVSKKVVVPMQEVSQPVDNTVKIWLSVPQMKKILYGNRFRITKDMLKDASVGSKTKRFVITIKAPETAKAITEIIKGKNRMVAFKPAEIESATAEMSGGSLKSFFGKTGRFLSSRWKDIKPIATMVADYSIPKITQAVGGDQATAKVVRKLLRDTTGVGLAQASIPMMHLSEDQIKAIGEGEPIDVSHECIGMGFEFPMLGRHNQILLKHSCETRKPAKLIILPEEIEGSSIGSFFKGVGKFFKKNWGVIRPILSTVADVAAPAIGTYFGSPQAGIAGRQALKALTGVGVGGSFKAKGLKTVKGIKTRSNKRVAKVSVMDGGSFMSM